MPVDRLCVGATPEHFTDHERRIVENFVTTETPGMISVIMPCFNAEQFLAEAISSALLQNDGRVELIVIDDGSTDGSRALLKELAAANQGQMQVLHQTNRGPYPARNLGLRRARGAYIAFLDADDYWHPGCLGKLRAAIDEAKADVAYCGWQNIGASLTGDEPYVPPCYEHGDTVVSFLKSCPWPIHAALVRHEVIRAVGGFSERYFSSMDYDFWLRILAHTRRMTRVAEVLAFYRWHGQGQISSTNWRQVIDAWQVRRDFVKYHPQLIGHIPSTALSDLVDGAILKAAYRAYWRRDFNSAQPLFRKALALGRIRWPDLKYAFPSLLPPPIYRSLLRAIDGEKPRE